MEAYASRLRALVRRWDPRGVLIGDEEALEAARLLRERPDDASEASLRRAERVYDAAVHPVLEQPIPSAFRVSSFLPTTSVLALGMVASREPKSLLLCVLHKSEPSDQHSHLHSHSQSHTRSCASAHTPMRGRPHTKHELATRVWWTQLPLALPIACCCGALLQLCGHISSTRLASDDYSVHLVFRGCMLSRGCLNEICYEVPEIVVTWSHHAAFGSGVCRWHQHNL